MLLGGLSAGCGVVANGLAVTADPAADAARHTHPLQAIATENFAEVNATLYRGGLPADSDMQALAKLGVKTDVDLMGGGNDPTETAAVAHEKQVAAKFGIQFVSLPLPFNVQVPTSMIDQWLGITSTAADQPVYVHCRHGRDRTGTMVALYRIEHDHWTNQQALTEMESFGYNPQKFPLFTQLVLSFHPAASVQ
jgi:protein tyrosine/serine phosphatase